MKVKIPFPDWTGPFYLKVSKKGDGKAEWTVYEPAPHDLLSSRATLDIAGGSRLFERFESEEEARRVRLERDRQTAWRNGVRFADMLWKTAPFHEYVVYFRPGNEYGPEAVCIARRLWT